MTRFGSFLFLLRCCLLRRRRWRPGWLARQVGRARARACFSNATHGPPKQVLAPLGHTRTMLMKFASHREAMKCVVLSISRGWGMTSNTRIMHTYVKCMSSIVIMHGPIDHEVSASHSHVLILGHLYLHGWMCCTTCHRQYSTPGCFCPKTYAAPIAKSKKSYENFKKCTRMY